MGTECPYLLLENWPGRLLKGDKVSCKRWTFRQVIGAIIFIRQPHTGSVHFAPLRLWVYPGRQFKAVWMGNGTAHLLEAGTFLPTWFPPTVKTHTQAHRSLQENGSPVISGHNWPSFLQPQIHSQRAHNWTKAECLWLTQDTTKDFGAKRHHCCGGTSLKVLTYHEENTFLRAYQCICKLTAGWRKQLRRE